MTTNGAEMNAAALRRFLLDCRKDKTITRLVVNRMISARKPLVTKAATKAATKATMLSHIHDSACYGFRGGGSIRRFPRRYGM